MAKDLPSFIAQEGANREGSVIREKNFIDANNYETVAYLKHLDVRNEPKMVLFENVPALSGQKSPFPMFYNPWVSRQYVADSLDMGDIKSPMEVSLEVAKLEQQQGKIDVIAPEKAPVKEVVLTGEKADLRSCRCPCTKKAMPGPYHTMTCAMKGLNKDFYDITLHQKQIS